MGKLLRWAAIGLLVLAAIVATVWAYLRFVSPPVVELTQEQIMASLGPRFPLRNCTAVGACIELSEPALRLVEGSERIDISTRFDANLGEIQVPGRLAFSGKLRYVASEGSFYFDDLEVSQLDLEGVPPFMARMLRERGIAGVTAQLQNTPIYTFDTESRRERLAMMLLGDVRVQEGRLRIQFLRPAD
ncbi:DUF1439 domain-containing protein [Rivibacter subsaxonicus]|uniref:Uncharacterized protein DUF1439 n=1 Tax=Rivibacter subsaxonicus TaxID=457575 RepID=A0A4Q7V589_9BURK|nr:DUF1439 domain-containing protein [Rivibacter subsaxonicus]RZT91435.1 uncharacterized protein DUF1439 [Rivibacter subsaxonicus]